MTRTLRLISSAIRSRRAVTVSRSAIEGSFQSIWGTSSTGSAMTRSTGAGAGGCAGAASGSSPRTATGSGWSFPQSRHVPVEPATRGAPPAAREAEPADEGGHGDEARDQVDCARPGRLGPEEIAAEGESRRHGNEPCDAELEDHAVADALQDRRRAACDRQQTGAGGEHEEDAQNVPNLTGCQARPRDALAPFGTRGGCATGARSR